MFSFSLLKPRGLVLQPAITAQIDADLFFFCRVQVYKTESVTTLNNSDFTVVIVTVGSASGSLKAEPKECLTGKGQVLSKGLRA